MCRRLRVGKKNLLVALLVSAAMCSACLCGSHEPLAHNALRGSGPGQKPAFEMQGHLWVVLITGSTGSALRAVRRPNLVYAASATAFTPVRECDRGNLRWSRRQQCCDPETMFGAIDLGIPDHRQRAGR